MKKLISHEVEPAWEGKDRHDFLFEADRLTVRQMMEVVLSHMEDTRPDLYIEHDYVNHVYRVRAYANRGWTDEELAQSEARKAKVAAQRQEEEQKLIAAANAMAEEIVQEKMAEIQHEEQTDWVSEIVEKHSVLGLGHD